MASEEVMLWCGWCDWDHVAAVAAAVVVAVAAKLKVPGSDISYEKCILVKIQDDILMIDRGVTRHS